MNREEIIKLISANVHHTKTGTRYVDTKLIDDFIKHEQDTLKEFVEWYKERLVHIQEHEKELLDDDVKHEYSYLVEYRKGTTDMLERLLSYIDTNLTMFLEEREK